MPPRFTEGDRVRIDIPDETDPDHAPYHGEHGQMINVLDDDAAVVTGNPQDARFYRVALETGDEIDCRGRDLRPPLDE